MHSPAGIWIDPSGSVHAQAPAKLNLTLAVLGKRGDGFHDIESCVVKIAWFDHLCARPAEELSLSVRGEIDGADSGESNLVLKAARALARAAGLQGGAAIELDKSIPVGAGLGGGSSDAAAILLALNRLWSLEWTKDRLAGVGAAVGSDVPLFLLDGPCVIRGRGERVEPMPLAWRGWAAVVVPPFQTKTADVYGRWQAGEVRSRPTATDLSRATTARELSELLFNDLLPAALVSQPGLASLLTALNESRGPRLHLTGSGSCLFALFDSQETASVWAPEARPRLLSGSRIRVAAFSA